MSYKRTGFLRPTESAKSKRAREQESERALVPVDTPVKEPCICAKEPYTFAKEPYTSAKEPC